jgi:molybdenum cofactor biosynthesis protein MoaC
MAIAQAVVKVSSQKTIESILNRSVPKGDVFEFSRAAGLLACKKTHELIPDCHPIPVEFTAIRHEIDGLDIMINVEVHTVYKTGVEVEAMHGASVVALTIYDMLKPIDEQIEITSIKLLQKRGGKTDLKYAYPKTLKAVVITCSDSISKNEGKDESGDLVEKLLQSYHIEDIVRKLVPDDIELIQQAAREYIDQGYQLILLTGGTGLSARDITPDAIKPLIERDVPGIMEASRVYGQQRTPYAMLSRGVAGFAKESLLLTLPGSPKGAQESMQALFPALLHVFKVKEGVRHD